MTGPCRRCCCSLVPAGIGRCRVRRQSPSPSELYAARRAAGLVPDETWFSQRSESLNRLRPDPGRAR